MRRLLNDAPAALLLFALTAGIAGIAGCSRDGGTAEARAATGGQAGGIPGAGGGPRDGGPTLVLAESDVAAVERGSIEAGTAVTGDLRPIEEITVRARIEGDLDAVVVREGQSVREGQLMARFEASEEESNRQSAVADQVAAVSDVATAEWNAEQSSELFREGAIAEQANRLAQQQLAAARARLAAADARVRATGATVTDTRVLAPTTGIVATREVESGERVAQGATLFTLVRTDRLELAANVPARQANGIVPGQRVRFVADGQALEGQVARVSPTINPATRAVEVYVQVANPNDRLKGNTFASGRIIGRTVADALLVPAAAIRQTGEGAASYVYRITGDALERVDVRLGVVDDAAGIVEVVEGLAAGDRVIVGNVGAISAGARVQIIGEGTRANGGPGAGTAPLPRRP